MDAERLYLVVEEIMNKLLTPILVKKSTNCFVAALEALLGKNLSYTPLLANRHIDFYYNRKYGDGESFYIGNTQVEDIVHSLKFVEGIDISIQTLENVYEAKHILRQRLIECNPTLIFVDSFYLDYFPKSKGHALHAVIASSLDNENDTVFVSCSLPYQGTVSLDTLTIARNSHINHNINLKNAWLELHLEDISEIPPDTYLRLSMEENVKRMTRGDTNRKHVKHGLEALVEFHKDFVCMLQCQDKYAITDYLIKIFNQSLFVVDERKRFVNYLTDISQSVTTDISRLVHTYKKNAYQWDIFRNLCYKSTKSIKIEESFDNLVNKLDLIIESEAKGIEEQNTLMTQLVKDTDCKDKVKDTLTVGEKAFYPINLSEFFNNDGISYDGIKSDGAFDEKGATYPAEELPASNSVISLDGIPFLFPSKENGCKNNMVLSNNISIPILENHYEYLYILGAIGGTRGEICGQEMIVVFNDNSEEFIYFRLSNWLLDPEFRERTGFVCSHIHYPDTGQISNRNSLAATSLINYQLNNKIVEYRSVDYKKDMQPRTNDTEWKPKIWFQRVALPTHKPIKRIEFEEKNLVLHIFCMTLESNT
jgi:hypothetical protein